MGGGSRAPRTGRRALRRALLLSLIAAAPARAQQPAPQPPQQQTAEQRLRAEREALERIRRERAELQSRMRELQGTVHDLTEEAAILDRQAAATAKVVRSLESELATITEQVDDATTTLIRAQDELIVKRATLQRRLADIYKRGPLYSLEALLSAQSFGELVARYKYLHQLALRDRALVRRVEELRNRISGQRVLLVNLRSAVEQNRAEKQEEELRLRTLEQARQKSLAVAKTSQRQTQARLAQIARDEARLAQVITSIEAARVRADARRPSGAAPAASTLRTADLGRLDWPVEGTIIYRFGRVVNPNNTTTRWNGIGIQAPQGTPVRAIADGEVAIAEPFGTYGLTVIVQHGAGDYSIYSSLQRLEVQKGAKVAKGTIIGAVGAADPDLPAHLHFEIRRAKGVAVDPLDWLRARR